MNGNKYIAELEGVMSSYRRVLGTKVDLIPTKLRTYTYDTPTHFRVGQPLKILVT